MADSRTNAGLVGKTVRVICGDCREEIKKLDENSVHLIATDPPYGTDGMGENWDSEKLKKKVSRASVVGGLPVGMKFDVKQAHKIQQFFETVAQEALRVLRPGGFFLSFSSPRLSHRIAIALEQAGFEIRDMYAWHYKRGQGKAFGMDHFIDKMQKPQEEKDDIKRKIGGRQTAQLRPQFEPVIVAQKPRDGTLIENWLVWETGLVDLKNTRIDGRPPTTVLEVEKPARDPYNGHLTVKPVRLMETLIQLFSREGQVVLDPFLGSGTTLLAAKNTGRHGIGIEIHPDYVEIAKKRLEI